MNRPLARLPFRAIATMPLGRRVKWLLLLFAAVAIGIAAHFVDIEIETSRLQAHYLSDFAHNLTYTLESGPSDSIRFPVGGPYDTRLGYAALPSFVTRLTEHGFVVTHQARDSLPMLSLANRGLYLPYDEKDRAGLQLFDETGAPLYSNRYPTRTYDGFEQIPPLVVDALTFIEDRYLLDPGTPNRNPAIDWGRFSRALTDQAVRLVNRRQAAPGGSTLATQIEKFRHSPGGRTGTPPEKLRQIASASVLAYLDGPETLPARKAIIVHYLNTEPLAAQSGIGEVDGLGDGLAAWYGRDFDEINRLVASIRAQTGDAPVAPSALEAQALAFKQVLSLLVAQRAPSYYLRPDSPVLEPLTDSYLRVLAANGVISAPLRDAALAAHLELKRKTALPPPDSFVTRKAVTSLRAHLMSTLGIKTLYDLDRIDLSAHSTLNDSVQQAVSDQLARAATKDGAQAAGLYGFEMLRPGDDPSKITFSFTLFERRNGENLVRVQTDSVNEPFDINQGARLNLGSTAKLRTVITYLQIVTELHTRYASMSPAQLKQVQPDPLDALSRWAIDYLQKTPDHSLSAMLNEAIERKYSASAGEVFYTGGGAQTFTNFEASDNSQVLTIHRAFQHSVNLVFVRLMRDIVHYEMIQAVGPSASWVDAQDVRDAYLAQFVDQESKVYLHRFYTRYQGKTPDDALALLLTHVSKSPSKVATVLRSVAPDASITWFSQSMRAALKGTPSASLDIYDFARLYEKYGIDKFDLNDRGYISGMHPLELWTVNYLRQHPNTTEAQLQTASHDVRVYTYKWLYKTRYHATQDRRIRHMVELQAYQRIGQSWRALGYPFESLTPSFAAAIGASGDRPAALAELIGIIESGGKRLPTESLSSLEFATGTPFETRLSHARQPANAVLPEEIIGVVQVLLRDVVLGGTAKRLSDGMPLANGKTLDVFGKTGTGDQRFEVFASGHRLIESRKVNRSATFVFEIGQHFYGTLTAYVHEPYAARYNYTSALAVQLLKSLAPALDPLLAVDEKGTNVAQR